MIRGTTGVEMKLMCLSKITLESFILAGHERDPACQVVCVCERRGFEFVLESQPSSPAVFG